MVILVPLVLCGIRDYYFINMNMNWTAARQYCRDKYTDLATVESADDLNRIDLPVGALAWIGLFDDPVSWKVMTTDSNSWKWSSTGTISASLYQNWIGGEPNDNSAREGCVIFRQSQWATTTVKRNTGPLVTEVSLH